MNIIRPSTITADKLHSSTVPETDYAEYAAGTTYADGDKVIVAASHKIYESLQDGNVGHAVTDTAWWLDCGYTNRWKSFDQKVTSQSSQASEMTWVFELGTYVDSLSMHNLDASEAQIIVADQAEDLITNGDDWTGATGITPPNGWDTVNTPSDFTIDSEQLKLTADGSNEGISQDLTVTPETEYQMLGTYRNTSGDTAQYAIWDVTNNGIEQEAASAAGIQVSDNDNLDMATNNFALHWEGSLPDWTPSAAVTLWTKQIGAVGITLAVHTDGKLKLTLNANTYTSTAANTLADGSAAKITAVVNRETAAADGSVTFYVHGVALGTPVAIAKAEPATVSNDSPLYIIGTSTVLYAGTTFATYLFNRALTSTEVFNLCQTNYVDNVDRWGSQTNLATNGDCENGFTDGVITGWSKMGAGVDAYSQEATTVHSGVYSQRIDWVSGGDTGIARTALEIGKRYKGTAWVRATSAVKFVIQFGGSVASASVTVTPNVWTLLSVEAIAPTMKFYVYVDTGQKAGDVYYIDDIELYEVGATLALEPEGIRLDKWHDSSDNNLDATYPASGYSFAGEIDPITDLASSTVDKTLSVVFTTPAECETVRVSLLAKSSGDIVWFDRVSLAPTVYNETIALLNTVAVVDWYTYFYEPIVMATDLVKTDLATVEVPPISTASITMIVTNTGGTAAVGEIIMGLKFNIGRMKYRPSVSINNFSGKTVDAFGDTTITPRGWSKKLNCELNLKNTVVDEVYRQYTLYKDTAIVWVGDPDHSILVVYGLWKNFEIVLPYPDYSVCNLQIEGLT
jgi:hypothetical protein